MLTSGRTTSKEVTVDPIGSTATLRVVRSSRFVWARTVPVAALAFVVSGAGCGRTMSQADCEKVGNHMREVWDSDVKANAPSVPEGAAQDLAQLVIKNHRERIGSEWMNQCRRELEGRHVDEKELDCIMKSKTIADVQSCATRSGE